MLVWRKEKVRALVKELEHLKKTYTHIQSELQIGKSGGDCRL